jgi:hypothetical protein
MEDFACDMLILGESMSRGNSVLKRKNKGVAVSQHFKIRCQCICMLLIHYAPGSSARRRHKWAPPMMSSKQ